MSACCEPTPQGAFSNKPSGMQPQVYRGIARDGGYDNVTRDGQAYPSNYQPSETNYRTQSPFMSGRSERREPVTNWGAKGVPASFDAHRSPPRVSGTFDVNGAYESQRRETGNYASQVCSTSRTSHARSDSALLQAQQYWRTDCSSMRPHFHTRPQNPGVLPVMTS